MTTNRRKFLGIAGGTVAGVAVTGGVVYSATELLAGSAGAAEIDGVSGPQYTELTPFRDPLRIPPTLKPRRDGVTEIEMVNKDIRLHSQLPPVPMWTYEGHFPGPQIEAERGEKVRITWTNRLKGTIPVKAVFVEPSGPPPGIEPYNSAGSNGAPTRPEIDKLTAWTSVHLHGGHQQAIYDGMADSGVTPGSTQYAEYLNEKSAHLFYHDHAMPVTGPNVLAGLSGSYIIRDGNEDKLDLPKGRYDVTLAISDINFEKDSKGRLEGRILDKRVALGQAMPGMNPPSAAFEGPFTMCNGVIWPHFDVEARAYRFRIVNTSLTRQYILALLDETTGKSLRGAIKVIGTDVGLLDQAKVIDESLSLTPAERVDIVIDFSQFPGKKLRFVNTVPGTPAGTPVPGAGLGRPEVMQFRVDKGRHSAYNPPKKLSSDFKQLTAKDIPKDAVERFVALYSDKLGMPTIIELQEVSGNTAPGDGIVQIALPGGTRTFRSVANYFEDRTTFFAEAGSWEKWTFINAGAAPIPHPMHIHLIEFQLLQRNAVAGIIDPATQGTPKPLTPGAASPIAPEESGWKDVVLVPGNSMVTVAGRFGDQTGRFMYHCHLLDHEDDGMMRPLVIMPKPVLDVQKLQMASMNMMGSMDSM